MNRPETTLFMLVSVDGKISTGDNDSLDFDDNFPKMVGIKEGLQQYYDIEQTTDLYSLNSGRVMAKIGINDKKVEDIIKTQVNYIVIDDSHLTKSGVLNMAKKANELFIITSNDNHPSLALKDIDNLEIISYEGSIDFSDLFKKFFSTYGIEKLTIQTGGTLNSLLLRAGLIDHLSIVLAPCLVGGRSTSTLIDGESLHSKTELFNVKPLKLVGCKELENSYIHLKYDVLNCDTGENL